MIRESLVDGRKISSAQTNVPSKLKSAKITEILNVITKEVIEKSLKGKIKSQRDFSGLEIFYILNQTYRMKDRIFFYCSSSSKNNFITQCKIV